jgi:DNA-binding IclR family transcriptional regulator
VKVPEDSIIPNDKITRYLLVQKARNDKSKFLAQAGFTTANPEALRTAIQSIAERGEAIENRRNEYGVFYQVVGELVGTNGITLIVVTIWLQRQIDGKFQFVTLKPLKET